MSRYHHEPRSTTTRDRHRASIRRGSPPCHICKQDIDYSLPHTDPMAYVVDHIMPLSKGGPDALDNKAAAHKSCNRNKSDHLYSDGVPVPWVTSRQW